MRRRPPRRMKRYEADAPRSRAAPAPRGAVTEAHSPARTNSCRRSITRTSIVSTTAAHALSLATPSRPITPSALTRHWRSCMKEETARKAARKAPVRAAKLGAPQTARYRRAAATAGAALPVTSRKGGAVVMADGRKGATAKRRSKNAVTEMMMRTGHRGRRPRKSASRRRTFSSFVRRSVAMLSRMLRQCETAVSRLRCGVGGRSRYERGPEGHGGVHGGARAGHTHTHTHTHTHARARHEHTHLRAGAHCRPQELYEGEESVALVLLVLLASRWNGDGGNGQAVGYLQPGGELCSDLGHHFHAILDGGHRVDLRQEEPHLLSVPAVELRDDVHRSRDQCLADRIQECEHQVADGSELHNRAIHVEPVLHVAVHESRRVDEVDRGEIPQTRGDGLDAQALHKGGSVATQPPRHCLQVFVVHEARLAKNAHALRGGADEGEAPCLHGYRRLHEPLLADVEVHE